MSVICSSPETSAVISKALAMSKEEANTEILEMIDWQKKKKKQEHDLSLSLEHLIHILTTTKDN